MPVEQVSASVTPGLTVLSATDLSVGVQSRSTIKLPDGYAPIGFPYGTAAGQVSAKWADSRTYAANTPVTLDLSALTAAASNTGAASFAKVKLIAVYNNAAPDSGANLVIGGAASTPFLGPLGGTTPTLTVKAGCCVILFDRSTAGWSTSGASNLKIDPGTSAVNATVVICGN